MSPVIQRAESIRPQEIVDEIFIGASNKATVLRAVIENYLKRSGVDIKPDHRGDNLAMAISLVASTRRLTLMPAYAKNLLPWSVVSRPLEGDVPTIDHLTRCPLDSLFRFASSPDDAISRLDYSRASGPGCF